MVERTWIMEAHETGMRGRRDPVCGMSVPQAPSHQCRYREAEYGFCSEHCLRQFKRHPDYYLGGKPQVSAPARGAPSAYTCPMHPEVRQEGPGDCQKCGMALEPEGVPALAEEAAAPERGLMARRFWACLALTGPVFLLAMTTHLGFLPAWLPLRAEQWAEFALATPVVMWGGWPFLVRGWQSLASRNYNMFTLVGLGVAVAWGSVSYTHLTLPTKRIV